MHYQWIIRSVAINSHIKQVEKRSRIVTIFHSLSGMCVSIFSKMRSSGYRRYPFSETLQDILYSCRIKFC
jgi:hypothetical protein